MLIDVIGTYIAIAIMFYILDTHSIQRRGPWLSLVRAALWLPILLNQFVSWAKEKRL